MNKLIRFLFFSLISFPAFAQVPDLRIIRVNAENYCLGTELSIDVDITGTFPPDNKFTVVAYRNWNNPALQWEYPAELRGDKLVTILKEPSLANSGTFGIRIRTSNPQREIDANYSIKALTKSSVHLTTRWGFTADTINSTDKIVVTLTTKPSSPGIVVLSSGDTLKLISSSSWATEYTVATLPKTKEGLYYIKEASNVCGAMTVSGQVNVKINPIDFIPTAFSPKTPCEGGEIKVRFNTNGAEFNTNTKFRIRFSYDNSYMDSYKYMDAPAVLSDKNELTVRIPENLIRSINYQDIYLGIVADNPSAISINKSLKMYAYLKPSFTLTAEKYNIRHGDSFYISTNPTGMPPFKITLTNGDVLQYSETYSPDKTTQYQVKTFESGCGLIQNPPNPPITVHIQPSLLLGKSANYDSPKIYCEGQTVRIPLRTSGVNSQTSYVLEVNTFSGKKISIPAWLVKENLEFVVPKNISQDPDLDFSRMSGIRVVSNNPSLTSPYTYVKFQGPPTMVMDPNSANSVATPSAIWMNYNLFGGGPFELEMKDGSKLSHDSYFYSKQQFIRKDTTFQLARLSNACFSNSNPPSFPLMVLEPASSQPSLFACVSNTNFCAGDSVEVEVFVHGKFESGNQFTLSNTNSEQISLSLTPNFTGSNIYKIKLPKEGYDQDLQLVSTLPRLVSRTQRIYFKIPSSKPSISPVGKKESPVGMYLGNNRNVHISTSEFSPIIYSLDGIESTVLSDHNGNYTAHLPLKNNTVSEFKLKSVNNVCGAWNGEIVSYYYGIGYKLILARSIYPMWNCAGSEAEVRFSFENGQAEPGTKFTLQISATGSADSYTDLANVTDSPVFRFITPNLKAGSYYIRILSSDNIYSEASNFLIGQIPTAKLTTGYPIYGDSVATVNYGSQVYLTANLTGNEPFGIMYSDGSVKYIDTNQDSYRAIVTDSLTFTISKVWNSCGYGIPDGRVKVTAKPILELNKFPLNTDPTICPGQKVELSYAVKGASLSFKDYIVFYISSNTMEPVKLDSVNQTSGRIQLTIPANLSGEFFSIIAKNTAFQLEKFVGFQLYATPDMTLIGNNTITAGETTTLFVRSNSVFASNSVVELSNSTSFKISDAYPGGITEIKVTPATTTTYTLKATQNVCGLSKISGSATITVLPKLAQWLSFERIEGLRRFDICNSDTVRISFYHFGSQSLSAGYEVQLSDSTGNNFVSIPTSGDYSSLLAVIPDNVKKSGFHRIRLISKDPKVSGSSFPSRLRIGERARAKVLTPSVYYQSGQPVEAVIRLDGSNPFSYHLGDENFSQYRRTNKYLDTIRLTPTTPLATFKITQLSNECGPGKVDEPSAFKIELITSVEPLTERINFGPNPTHGILLVRFEDNALRHLELTDLSGRIIFKQQYTVKEANINLSSFPAGIYLLKVKKKQAETTYRVFKN